VQARVLAGSHHARMQVIIDKLRELEAQ